MPIHARLPFVLLTCRLAIAHAQTTDRGAALFQSHDWEAARPELTAVVNQNDADARAHYFLGRPAIVHNDLER